MTSKSNIEGRSALVNRMLEAAEDMRSMPPPERRIRIHPDDFAELKKSLGSWTMRHPTEMEVFCGVDLVIDSRAPRMPTKTDPL